jgi:hypothetical protein
MDFRTFVNSLPLIALAFVFVSFFVLAYNNIKKEKAAFKGMAGQFNGYCPKFSLSCCLIGEFKGLPLKISYIPPYKNSPEYLRYYLKYKAGFKLRIYPETINTRLSKMVRVVREVEIKDVSFDEAFLILSNDPGRAVKFLSVQDKKDTVRELFKRGFDSLVMDGKMIFAFKPYGSNGNALQDLTFQKTREVLELMFKFGSGAEA